MSDWLFSFVKKNLMDKTVLTELKNNKATPCVSVIIPTHTSPHEHVLDELEVDKMLTKAKDQIINIYGRENGEGKIIEKIDELLTNIDYTNNGISGIGFFVSPDISHIVKFPFPVKEKVVVGNNFEIRDVLHLAETMLNYYVLQINEKGIKFYKGNGTLLQEVSNENFPARFFDNYEYTHTSIGSSYGYSLKSTEKDKSVVKEQRLISNLKHIDQVISNYLSTGTPFIISGNSKNLGYFKKISANYEKIGGVIHGNYVHEDIKKFGELCFDRIKNYLHEKENDILKRLDNAIGKKLAVYGIEKVWESAREGKGLILLVEQNFSCEGFLADGGEKLLLKAPKSGHKVILDVVDDIIEIVIQKNGKVVLVEDGKLEHLGRIAMILRYQ